MHAGAATVQVTCQQGRGGEWLVFGPLHEALHMRRGEFLRCPTARLVGQRGKSVLPPAKMDGSHGAHVQTQLIRYGLGKQPRIEQQQCLRPFAFAPVAGMSGDALQLGAAVLIELQCLASCHSCVRFKW